jgi:tetratricopeptide (TPR) repeat protein
LAEQGERYVLTGPLPPLAIPATLHDSLMARLDRLAPVKEVAQLGAVLGREVSRDLLAAVAGLGDARLQAALTQLVAAGLLYQRGEPPATRYLFKHALIQDAAYQSLLRSRRLQLHLQVAQVLEERFPEVVETQPELLAHHYTAAGMVEPALPYWQRAGEQATARAANREAIAHLERGLSLIHSLPDGPERDQREVGLRVVLGPCLIALKGHAAPDVAASYTRAYQLCGHLGDTPEVVFTLFGLSSYEAISGRHRRAYALAEQCLRSAQAVEDPSLMLMAHGLLGVMQFDRGEFTAADASFKRQAAMFDPERDAAVIVAVGVDSVTGGGAYLGWIRWLLGYPDQAVAATAQAVARGRALNRRGRHRPVQRERHRALSGLQRRHPGLGHDATGPGRCGN